MRDARRFERGHARASIKAAEMMRARVSSSTAALFFLCVVVWCSAARGGAARVNMLCAQARRKNILE